MKKLIFIHIFLNLYLLAIIQPALPIIEYFINYEYIASVLCENKDNLVKTCNGKCYLEKEVSNQQNIDVKNHAPKPPKVDFEKLIVLQNKKLIYSFTILNNHITKNPLYYPIFDERSFIDNPFRPPIS